MSKFHQCQLTGANFQRASATKIVGNSVELSEAKLTGCNFTYANFSGSNIIKEVDFSSGRIGHARLDGASLSAAILVDCELHSIEADRLRLDHAALRGATLPSLDVRNIDATGVKTNLEQAATLP